MEQLVQEALARLVIARPLFRAELADVENIAVEDDDLDVLGLAVLALNVAAAHDQQRALLVLLDDLAFLGQIGHHLALVALVMDHQAEQVAVRRAVGDVHGQPRLGRGELARLQHLADQVGAHLDGVVAQEAAGQRRQIRIAEGHEDGDEDRQHQIGLHHPPGPRARGRKHDQLAVAGEPVQRVQRRDQERDRRHDRDQVRHGEQGDVEEDQEALALIRDERNLPQRGRHPDDQRQRGQNHRQ